MNLQKFLSKSKLRFRVLWNYKVFKYAVIIHGGYFIISLILTLIFFRNKNDFRVYYDVGGVVLKNVNDLYTTPYNWPFRYLPIASLFFVPFHLMGFDLGFIIFNSLNLILNILICSILYKLIIFLRGGDHEKGENRVILYISIFLMSLPNFFNYILGQINLYVTLLILLSLYIFMKKNEIKWEFVASFFLGISILIKPITIFMIPFILVIHYDFITKKLKFDIFRSFIRFIGIILPLSFNLIMFLILPNLLDGFIEANFTSSEPSQINHSFSITKLIINFLYFIELTENQVISLQMLLFFLIAIIFISIGFISYILRRTTKYSILYGYCFGISIMFLCYFDSWDHHLLNLTPLLTIIIFNLPRQSNLTKKYIKPSLIFMSFFDLAFMGLFFIIEDFFPFNFGSTIFLIIIFYVLVKYSITKNNPP
ncbi:MAG: glycosyltransferase family 87 protein [Candidatus Hodarchaeota archaeon]